MQIWLLICTLGLTRDDQRAWVGVEKLESPSKIEEIKEGSPVSVNLVWKNFGKSPALQTDVAAGMRIMGRTEEFEAVYDSESGPETAQETNMPAISGAIWPSVTYRSPRGSLMFTKQQATDIQRGEQRLYVYGKATYRDAFGRPHSTHFCSRFVPESRTWRLHDTYSEAN